MNKKLRIGLLVIICLTLAGGIVYGSAKLSTKLTEKHYNPESGCDETKATIHTAVIENDYITPASITAKRCDKLTIINKDDKIRIIAFGMHNQHVAYDGVTERPLLQGKSFTITLDTAGNYLFHDHRQEEVKATFTVNP